MSELEGKFKRTTDELTLIKREVSMAMDYIIETAEICDGSENVDEVKLYLKHIRSVSEKIKGYL